ncbi:MAG: deoxyribodipyrimidine photo-lyase [Thermoanaerobaculia bacterium]|nr:deoxyribodipyrimidine photo-lyase [Thermoanaerobaculia bacterium]
MPSHSFQPFRKHLERGGAGGVLRDRVEHLGGANHGDGEYVVYWAQSARRLRSNLALDYAIHRANEEELPVVVYESIRPDYPGANDRIHSFVLEGVAANHHDALKRGLRYLFFLPRTRDEARGGLKRLAQRARLVVTDEFPTSTLREQTRSFAASAPCPVVTVDGNGILPMRVFGKEQYMAKQLRDRAFRLFEERWGEIPELETKYQPYAGELDLPNYNGAHPRANAASCSIDHSVAPVPLHGGREEGLRRLDVFVRERLSGYAGLRNREAHRTSELSPYLHFGYLSAHEVARRALFSDAPAEDVDAFLEQLVIRRELSFNLCFYRDDYASLACLPDWAKKTLAGHADDRRHPVYSHAELERAETGDEVWNLAQRGLLSLGTIHNYLRMLWGKKIIEWSKTPEEAHAFMVAMHDKYAIDGRDPNTHAGILWCFGKHDRPWFERPIFGTIRYLASESTKKKVDLPAYARKIDALTS